MNGRLVTEFPGIGPAMSNAFQDLFRAETAKSADEVRDLDPLESLPRPWDVATIDDPDLRLEVWGWLDEVVGWLNIEYLWDVGDVIPPCWPSHPHLVHELGVVADQRRRAGLAFTSDALEEWHRYTLPYFIDRMRNRYRGYCEDGHQQAPGTSRNRRYGSPASVEGRQALYSADAAAVFADSEESPPPDCGSTTGRRRYRVIAGGLVDTDTGEITYEPDR